MKIVHTINNKMQNEMSFVLTGTDLNLVMIKVVSSTSNDGDYEEINIEGDIKYVLDYFETMTKMLKKEIIGLVEDGLLAKDFRK